MPFPTFSLFPLSRFLRIAAVLLASVSTLPVHASLARRADSPLPIETSAAVSGVAAYETGDRLIVSGRISPGLPSPAAHVDIRLVASCGRVLAEDVERLRWPHPGTAAGRAVTARFTAGFPLASVREATRIVVSFRNGPHAECSVPRG